MKAKELREKNINELVKYLQEERSKAQALMFEVSVKQEKDHRELRNTRRNISRILTVINEKNKTN